MPRESHLEFKVGIFVLAALTALTFFIWSISDTSVFEEGMEISAVFNFANGLKKNAPVRVAGVEEGVVKNVSLFFDRDERKTKVRADLWVNKRTRIPADSVFTINQLGLLGEKYVEIIPGRDTVGFISHNQSIPGKDPVSQEAISEKVLVIANKFDDSITGLNKIIADQENILSISKILSNLSDTSLGLKDLVAGVNEGRGTVGRLFYDNNLYTNLEAMTADLKENPWKLLYRPKSRSKER